jgi:plastocyanin
MPRLLSIFRFVPALLVLCGAGTPAWALDLTTVVRDRDGAPVSHVVVYAVPDEVQTTTATAPANAAIGQHDSSFVPHILVVETGTLVEFPNTDEVSHHVYSFSPAKSFELPLYKGNAHEPLRFDVPGVVTLGCNIHDGMLGYILVVPTPHFVLTDEHGIARLRDIPSGGYSVGVWTPRMREERLPKPEALVLTSAAKLEFQFASKLFPPHAHEGTSLSWRDY